MGEHDTLRTHVKESLTGDICPGKLDNMKKNVGTQRKPTITTQANALREMIALKLGDLADELLGRPELGSPEWMAQTELIKNDEKARNAWHAEWHLLKLRIGKEAGVDLLGNVVNARKYRATWQEIGDACGITRQAAYDRWGKVT
jgi:hypothetical protein